MRGSDGGGDEGDGARELLRGNMPTSFWVVVSANRVTCLADRSRDISPP